MVEPIMYLAIGFLVSMLFGLMIVPLVHNRAVRLTLLFLTSSGVPAATSWPPSGPASGPASRPWRLRAEGHRSQK